MDEDQWKAFAEQNSDFIDRLRGAGSSFSDITIRFVVASFFEAWWQSKSGHATEVREFPVVAAVSLTCPYRMRRTVAATAIAAPMCVSEPGTAACHLSDAVLARR